MKGLNVLGSNIKKFTSKRGITAKELATKVGVSETHLSYISNQKRTPSLDLIEKIAEALEVTVDRLTGEAASSIIEDRLEETGMTLEEVAEKSGVSLPWLQKLDTFIPGEMDDIGEPRELEWDDTIGWYKSYEDITKVAEALGLPGAQLRAALARQEIPAYDGPQSSPEEDFGDVPIIDDGGDKKDLDPESESIENPDIRMIARAGEKMSKEDALELRKFAERLFPNAFKNKQKDS